MLISSTGSFGNVHVTRAGDSVDWSNGIVKTPATTPKQDRVSSLTMSPQSVRHQRDFSLSLFVGALSILVFLALHPIVLQFFSTKFLGGSYGDGGLYVWLTQSFIADPSAALRLETNGMYPYPLTRAWSDSFLLPSFLASALCGFGLSLSAAYNTVLVGAIGANGAAMYLLASRVGIERTLAAATGVIFANSSYLIGNLGHPQLLFFFWVLLAWRAVLPSEGAQRAPARAWCVAGVCVSGAFYSAVYYAIFAALGLGIIWLQEYLRGVSSERRVLRTALFGILGGLPMVYALPSYLRVQGYFGTRGLYEAEAFAATGRAYFSFTTLNKLYSGTAGLSHSEAWLGAGYVALAISLMYGVHTVIRKAPVLGVLLSASLLLVCGASSIVDSGTRAETLTCIGAWGVLVSAIALARKGRSPLATLVLIAAVFFVFSFGPGGNPVKNEPAYAPLGILYQRAPGLSAIRAVGRYGVVVIAVILLTSAQAIQAYLQPRLSSYAWRGVAVLVLVIGLLENLVLVIPFDSPRPAPQAVSEYVRHATPNDVAVVLPFGGATNEANTKSWSELAVLNTQVTQWSSNPEQIVTVVNGYSGQRSKLQVELPDILARFPDQEAFRYLGQICGVRTVLIDPAAITGWDRERFLGQVEQSRSNIEDKRESADGSFSIQLTEYKHTVKPGSDLTLFGPRDGTTRISLETTSPVPCEVTLASLGKSRKGEVEAVFSESVVVSGDMELYRKAPAGVSLASPHVMRLSTKGCEVVVGCGR
jgi:hypothetical protein